MRTAFKLAIAGAVVLAGATVVAHSYFWNGQEPEDATKTPFSAGFREGRTVDKVIGKPMELVIWYPSRAKEALGRFGTVRVRSARDATPAAGSFPLLVISHGTEGNQYDHHDTARYLARRGYVVVVPSHPEDNDKHHDRLDRWSTWVGRPRQVSLALDAVLADEGLGKLIDRNRIAAMGFSIGGHTVLAAAGGRARYSALASHCKRVGQSTRMCPDGDLLVKRDESVLAPPDRRIRAVVALAPVAAFFDKGAFKKYHAKTLIYRAEDDEGLPYPHHAKWLMGILPPGAIYRVAGDAGGGHEIFVVPNLKRDGDGYAVLNAFHQRLNAEIYEFLESALK